MYHNGPSVLIVLAFVDWFLRMGKMVYHTGSTAVSSLNRQHRHTLLGRCPFPQLLANYPITETFGISTCQP